MMTPVPLASRGLDLVQGRMGSGVRDETVIFTTESRMASVFGSSAA